MGRGIWFIVALVVCGLVSACDCGAGGPDWQPPDTEIDTGDEGELDVGGDGDVPDAAGDGEDGVVDVEEEDGVVRTANPFLNESAGGGTLASEHYTMELFIAPVRPTGSVESESYGMKLGPAGTRSP